MSNAKGITQSGNPMLTTLDKTIKKVVAHPGSSMARRVDGAKKRSSTPISRNLLSTLTWLHKLRYHNPCDHLLLLMVVVPLLSPPQLTLKRLFLCKTLANFHLFRLTLVLNQDLLSIRRITWLGTYCLELTFILHLAISSPSSGTLRMRNLMKEKERNIRSLQIVMMRTQSPLD